MEYGECWMLSHHTKGSHLALSKSNYVFKQSCGKEERHMGVFESREGQADMQPTSQSAGQSNLLFASVSK